MYPSTVRAGLTRTPDSWNVRCGDLGDFVQRCQFEIVDGEIQRVSDGEQDRPAEPVTEGAEAT